MHLSYRLRYFCIHLTSVSYTHLDVYKRQVLTLRKFRVLWLKLNCLNLSSDLVQSIAHRKATDTGVTVCSLLLILGE